MVCGNYLLLMQMHFFYELAYCCSSWSMLAVLLLWPQTSGIRASRYCAQMETCRENRYFNYRTSTALWIVSEQGNCKPPLVHVYWGFHVTPQPRPQQVSLRYPRQMPAQFLPPICVSPHRLPGVALLPCTPSYCHGPYLGVRNFRRWF